MTKQENVSDNTVQIFVSVVPFVGGSSEVLNRFLENPEFMNFLPRAKNENVVKVNSQGEVLLFDSETRRSFSLNKPAAIIFSHCNGTTLFSYLSRRYQFSEEIIYFTLDQLQKENLLAKDAYVSPFAQMERSEILRRIKTNSAINIPKVTVL